MAPANAEEFADMLRFAGKYQDGPIAIRYPRGFAFFCKKEIAPVELGKYEIIQKGKDIAILGIGNAFADAEKICELMKKDFPEIKPFLINPRFMKPLDTKFLESLKSKVKTIFTLEDNSLIGGFGTAIKDFYSDSDVKIYAFGIPDNFVTHGKISELRKLIGTNPEQIYKKIKTIIK